MSVCSRSNPWPRAALVAATLGASACSDPAAPPAGGSTGGSTTTTGGSATSVEGSTTTGDMPLDTTAATTPGTTDSTTGPEPTTTGEPLEPGCPSDSPASWILCEDFEAPGEPLSYFGDIWSNEGLLAVEEGTAWSGTRSLRVGHDPGIFSSGLADIRFGQGPSGGQVHAGDQTFREVWVRFHLRTQPGWPDAGIAEAVEVMSVSGPARAIAVDATIYSPTQAEAQALAWSCVHGSQLLCDQGLGDWDNPSLEVREAGLGVSPLYGTATAGQWQCHEIHLRLDDPGQANGEFEVFVDDQPEVSLQGITFVDAWADAGLNTVRFASFWNAPAVLDHHIDDVVVATAPIGCGS